MSLSRRRLLRDTVCASVGAASTFWLLRSRFDGGASVGSAPYASPSFGSTTFAAEDANATDGPEARVKKLGLELPKPGASAALLVPAVRSGSLLFVSGHIPRDAAGKPVVGKVGRDLDTKQAAEAARNVALHVLGAARAELGSLDRIVRLVKTLGMVNCTPDFVESPQVVNGFSQVLIDVFGEKAGRGARSAVGMASLPSGVPVEVEAIFEVRA